MSPSLVGEFSIARATWETPSSLYQCLIFADVDLIYLVLPTANFLPAVGKVSVFNCKVFLIISIELSEYVGGDSCSSQMFSHWF